jgi:hypothetical protein
MVRQRTMLRGDFFTNPPACATMAAERARGDDAWGSRHGRPFPHAEPLANPTRSVREVPIPCAHFVSLLVWLWCSL